MNIIGVSSCFMYPDEKREVFGHKTLCYMERDMARYLSRSDVLPVLIPDLGKTGLKKILRKIKGFVFQGGSDIAPETYGEKPILESKWRGDPYRDEYELYIMDYAIKHDKPVLAICRGFQLMNVYFGGNLYQDIEIQKENAIRHRDAVIYDKLHHGIEFSKDSLLDKLHRNKPGLKVNSVHHQGVREVGKGLEVQARCAEDGLVEAFLWKGADAGKVMGVQWHPEFFYNSGVHLIDADTVLRHFLSYLH